MNFEIMKHPTLGTKSVRPKFQSCFCTRVCVFHLTAPEVLAQLHALATIAEATETPGSVQTLLCTHTCLTLIHVWRVVEPVEGAEVIER